MSSIMIDVRPADIFARALSLPSRIVQLYATTPLQRAKMRAYRQFAARYPIWVEALFDLHFLNTAATKKIVRQLVLKNERYIAGLGRTWYAGRQNYL